MTNQVPQQTTRVNQSSAPRKNLSCTSCRQRKVKCDKVEPCGPCVKAEAKCTFPTRRVRASKARQDALEARDSELLLRIRRLEGMLASKVETEGERRGGDTQSNYSNQVSPPSTSDARIDSIRSGVAVNDQYAAFVKQQESSSRHLNSRFWSSLSNEMDGLRQLLEVHLHEEDEIDDTQSPIAEDSGSSPSFLLHDPRGYDDLEVHYPTTVQALTLFNFYFANVDPVCKILHRPTVDTYLSNMDSLVDPSTRRFKYRSLEAVTFAAYFAAAISMSSQDCLTHLDEDKDALIARYKHQTEVSLVQADFLNSLEITTLQAFTIYIVSLSSYSCPKLKAVDHEPLAKYVT
jgi:hypothetical protein